MQSVVMNMLYLNLLMNFKMNSVNRSRDKEGHPSKLLMSTINMSAVNTTQPTESQVEISQENPEAVDELLMAQDDIAILIDWSAGAKPPYAQASANIRVVGVQIALLIFNIVTYSNIPASSFHLIGHSLGAHLMGHCGTYLKASFNLTVSRITALDPAGPLFMDSHPMIRLDPTDGSFIDVIHTDNIQLLGFPLSIGMLAPVGHLDFYPNSGEEQPKCSYGNFRCHHLRATQLFVESIRQPCPFMAVVCENYDRFLKGECWPCKIGSNCQPMGFTASRLLNIPTRTKLFLKTFGSSPFCGSHYRIWTQTRRDEEGDIGTVGIELIGAKDSSGESLLSEKPIYFSPGSIHKTVILTTNVGNLVSVVVTFHYPRSIFNPVSWRISSPRLHLHSITVEALYPQRRWKFCFESAYLMAYLKYELNSTHFC